MPGKPLSSASIRPVRKEDTVAIAVIYNHYITQTVITFEEDPVSADEISRRVEEKTHKGFPWLVAEVDGNVVGYAYAGPWNPRSAYRQTVEVSIYLDPGATARGLGTCLYARLFHSLREMNRGFRVVIGGITLPNPASQALHEKFGFRQVACFRNVGFKFGQWLDVGYWQAELADLTLLRE